MPIQLNLLQITSDAHSKFCSPCVQHHIYWLLCTSPQPLLAYLHVRKTSLPSENILLTCITERTVLNYSLQQEKGHIFIHA